jgi:type I restriction enzyme M protein
MLDIATKRRIDTCRDILVGKVPDPKSQVEQITIALIYKFMDDMDAEAEELGGSRTFFAGNYEKYGWTKLMAPNMGGFDVLALYSEAIQKMNENPGIPALFRDIFKNAYLPYRDPETLRSFLKEINGFTYDHSERLGDAFEYLLSVLGSQGDAGQFRTPRNIIDFMVEIIDPKKDETILDPACGTAGFLISAWKHILKSNTSNPNPPSPPFQGGITNFSSGKKGTANSSPDKEGTKNSSPDKGRSGGVRFGDLLTPDERKRLAANIHGYDISPDMVRLSLVNMYLHGFTDPHIEEYDTLTSEEKWNEYADVIMANPPFMSPKGGIKPHKRFSVQATRSEVLFVDYMAEHLTPNGRAAIIVPEGIIFQSGSAYKQLREMLVKNCLVAVVSLPAGVFNPYSGVKTSILFLDKRLAKTRDSVLFAKVENDGFGLGAQRRAIDKNDLPTVAKAVKAWLTLDQHEHNRNLLVVEKARIGENDEWNLSVERYRLSSSNGDQLWPYVELGRVCHKITDGSHFSPETVETGFPYVTVKDLNQGRVDLKNCKKIEKKDYVELVKNGCKPQLNDVLFSKDGTVGKTAIVNFEKDFVVLSSLAIISPDISVVLPEYLYCLLSSEKFIDTAISHKTGVAIRRIVLKTLKTIQIPLPTLEVQINIVAEIEGYQKIIDGARQVVENYQPRITVNPVWPMVELSEVIKLSSGEFLSTAMKKEGPYPVYGGNGVNGYHSEYFLESPTVAIGRVGAYCGAVHMTEPKSWITDNGLYVKELIRDVDLTYLALSLRNLNLNQYAKIGGQPSISQSIVLERKIPLPDLDIQRAIVAKIEEEQCLVNANKELIRIFEEKIKTTINRVWREDA